MCHGVAGVQNGAAAGLTLVVRDDPGFYLDAVADQMDQSARIALPDRGGV